MSALALPIDARIEPTRELLRHLYIGGVSFSLRHEADEKLLAAARKLAVEGWLIDNGDYWSMGSAYTQFKAGARLDARALKDL